MASQDFWHRFNLRNEDRDICLRALRHEHVGYRVQEFKEQGYCSYTLLITSLSDTGHSNNVYSDCEEKNEEYRGRDERIVQLRPAPHALDLDIMDVASKTYSSLVPTIALLDVPLPAHIKAYTMNRLTGIPLSGLLPRTCTLTTEDQARLQTLISSFADFITQSWQRASKARTPLLPRTTRADSPMQHDSDMLSQCCGKVGSSIFHRLKQLAAGLPDAFLRAKAAEVLSAVQRVPDYPVVLSHGDLIPTNILVDQHSWEVTGVVDWAEAEFLPFGTCLYGLEHLLGYLAPASSDRRPAWIYFEDAERLRTAFWVRLLQAVPELRTREEKVKTMRDLGVLLWHGIAWDNGAIDRVVCESRDQEELAKLRAFLGAEWVEGML